VVLNMGALYQSILTSLSPLPFKKGENLDSLVSRIDLLRVKEREARKLENQINREKQFNRRIDLNRALNALKAEIEELKR
jgi:type II restriction/modification system DNA methylase subunit YeeA